MDTKAIISVLFAAVVGLIGWNIKTTNELQNLCGSFRVYLIKRCYDQVR